jgi:PEP-CTERM motif
VRLILENLIFVHGRKMKKSYLLAGMVAAAVSLDAAAAVITFGGSGTGPGGVAVTASAIFDITGNDLTITLRNTSPSNNGQDVPGSTLTGLFWDFTGNPTLTPFSATVGPGSSIMGTCDLVSCVGVNNVGGEFGYQATSLPGSADRGISSSGYLDTGLAGNIGNFNNGAAGTDLDKPASLDGINFGIISAAPGFNPNGGLDKDPLITDSVVFVLHGVSGLSINDISHVSFQYGTALSELNVPGDPRDPPALIPEPGTLSLLGLGFVGLTMLRRRQK